MSDSRNRAAVVRTEVALLLAAELGQIPDSGGFYDTDLEDLGMGVLDAVHIHRELEGLFGIRLGDDEFRAADTPNKLAALVTEKVGSLPTTQGHEDA